MKNDFMTEVYQSPNYRPFEFTHDYAAICAQFDNAPIVCHGYAMIVNRENRHSVTSTSTHESSLLKKHQLLILKWTDKDKHSHDEIQTFRKQLQLAMLRWEERYLSMLLDHFKERRSEDRALHNHNSIKIKTGEIVSELSYTAELINNADLYTLTGDKIINIAMQLHKLAGGRAFLQGNIVEMLCLFEVLKKIYL